MRQAFVFAVRSGLARLDVMEGTEGTEGAAGRPDLSPEQLEEHLRALGEDGDDPEDQPAPASPTPSAAGAGSEAPTSTPGPRPDEVVGSGGPDAPMEIEIPFEDVVNLEVVADPAPDRSDEAPTGPSGLPQHADPTAVLASSDPAAPRTPDAGSAGRPGPAGGFDHLPPPPPGVSDGDPTEEGARASWWRRRRSTGAGPAR